MARIRYIEKSFSAAHLGVIDRANAVCSAYKAQGYDLTLRQLYYQFVSRDWIVNDQREYKRLGGIINDARLAGQLDWDYIVDRTRELEGPGSIHLPHWSNPEEIVDAVANSYRINKWDDQDFYVEVWIEKDALKGVLESCCPELDVAFFSCRGYTSQSEIWTAAQRIGMKIAEGKNARVVHLGDHDPSGIDMTRDVEQRLGLFMAQDIHDPDTGAPYMEPMDKWIEPEDYVDALGEKFAVNRIALNMDQIRHYDPPPNPAKLSDSRATGYIGTHGYESWELDALEPTVLANLVREAVYSYRNDDAWEGKLEQEGHEREILEAISERWDEVEELLT